MLEQYFLRPTTVDRIRSNWLAPQIEQYVEWMHAQKYAGRNITRRVALLCHFADFARANGATDLASASSLIEKFGDHWLAGNRCWNLETRPKLRRDMCSIIRQMLRLITEGRVTRERGRPQFQFQSEAPGFFKYLLEERGMKKLTVARRVSPHVFRHSIAVGLLEQGVDVNVIRAWLGHVSLDTTHRYAEINPRTKQAAVTACLPPVDSSDTHLRTSGWHRDQDLMKWLSSL